MKRGLFALGACVAILTAAPAAASEDGPDWQVAFTPYVWVAGVKADIELPGGGTVDIDRPITSNLKFAFMGTLSVEHGNLVLLMDGNYLSLKSATTDIEAPTHLDGEVTTELLEVTPLAGYRVMDDGRTRLEFLGGARILSLKNDVHLKLSQGDVDVHLSRSTIAPVAAARLRTALGERWGLSLYGDIGGLTDLDLTWQLLATVNYRLGDRWTLGGGYRYLSLHSDKPRGYVDARFSGPLLGVSYRF